jgi:hypothetical protein
MAKIKKACESIKWDYRMERRYVYGFELDQQLRVLTVRVKNKKVHFVLSSACEDVEVIQTIFDRYLPELLFESTLNDMTHFIVFNNIAYPRTSSERKILVEAVKNKVAPEIQVILHSEKN